MSLSAIVALLQAALALLALAQAHPELPQATRDSAIHVAQQAITQATNALASNPTPSYSSPLTRATPTSSSSTHASMIGSCQEITASGSYTLSNDLSLSDNNKVCISIHDTSNVTLDCANHSITAENAINISKVSNFTITRCTINGSYLEGNVINIENSSVGQITGNRINALTVLVSTSDKLNVSDNTFVGMYQQNYTSNTVFSRNTMSVVRNDPSRPSSIASFVSNLGKNNRVINNVIDGKADGIWDPNVQVGADDGIVVNQEDGDLIQGNVIKNAFDCGIENSQGLSNTVIADNTIQNMGVCGIGGWHHSSFKGNTIRNNAVSDTPELFTFYRVHGLLPQGWDLNQTLPAEQMIYFQNNTFIDNKLVNKTSGKVGAHVGVSSFIDMRLPIAELRANETMPTQAQLALNSNVFKGNDFGTSLPPHFYPNSMIVDGGGNICTSGVSGKDGIPLPISCSGTITPAPNPTPAITVTYPNGGEQITYNSGKNVDFSAVWNAMNDSGTVYIYLVSTSGSQCLVGSTAAGKGNFPITLGPSFQCQNAQSTVVPGQYKIEVSGDNGLGDGKEVADFSDSYFTLSTAPSATIDQSSLAASAGGKSAAVVTISGSAQGANTVNVSLSNTYGKQAQSGLLSVMSGRWSTTFSQTYPGTYTVSVYSGSGNTTLLATATLTVSN